MECDPSPHMHAEHINMLSSAVVEARQTGTLSAGGIVNNNKCDTSPNPALPLFPIQGPRVLAKLDRGLSSRNEWLHIEPVVFVWAHQIAQVFLRCAGCNHVYLLVVSGPPKAGLLLLLEWQ